MPLDKTVIPVDHIKAAIKRGIANIELTMSSMPPHDLNTQMLNIIKSEMGEEQITNDLYTAGIALFYFLALSEVEAKFKANNIPTLMAGLFCGAVLDELRTLHNVDQYIKDTYKGMEAQR